MRDIRDTDNAVVVLERFDNLNLNPASPNFISRRIGDQYDVWDATTRRLKTYGEYINMSQYIRVEMNSDVEAGATDAALLPFGYFGPPKFTTITGLRCGTGGGAGGARALPTNAANNQFVYIDQIQLGGGQDLAYNTTSALTFVATPLLTGSNFGVDVALSWPHTRLRVSASAGKLTDPTDAYFGFMSTRATNSTSPGSGLADPSDLLYANFPDDPVLTSGDGYDPYAYVFTMDDIVSGSGGVFFWSSGSRNNGSSFGSSSYTDLLDADYNRFTAPFWGGADGWDITKPDPAYNKSMTDS